MKHLYLSVVLLLLLGPVVVRAQEERSLGPVSRTYAITNATIVQGPGRKIDQGTVVITDGLISAAGKNIAIPPAATIIKGDSLYVYAGFIDGLSHTGVIKPKEENNRERVKDPGNPAPERAGITPQTDVRYSLNPDERTIEELRALGFTAANAVPYGGMLPGNGAIILLGAEKTADPLVLVPKSALYSTLIGRRTCLSQHSNWRTGKVARAVSSGIPGKRIRNNLCLQPQRHRASRNKPHTRSLLPCNRQAPARAVQGRKIS